MQLRSFWLQQWRITSMELVSKSSVITSSLLLLQLRRLSRQRRVERVDRQFLEIRENGRRSFSNVNLNLSVVLVHLDRLRSSVFFFSFCSLAYFWIPTRDREVLFCLVRYVCLNLGFISPNCLTEELSNFSPHILFIFQQKVFFLCSP